MYTATELILYQLVLFLEDGRNGDASREIGAENLTHVQGVQATTVETVGRVLSIFLTGFAAFFSCPFMEASLASYEQNSIMHIHLCLQFELANCKATQLVKAKTANIAPVLASLELQSRRTEPALQAKQRYE